MIGSSLTWCTLLKGKSDYNQQCEVYWVGGDRILVEGDSSFVMKADSGNFISDPVLLLLYFASLPSGG